MEAEESSSFKILMFPWLAHGHIFPYLELARRILNRKNFHIYFCSTAINFGSIRNFIGANLLDSSIELVELHLQPCPELPPHRHTTKNLPPSLIRTLIKAFQTANSSFSNIINDLKPDLLIYDALQPWAAKLALSQGIPAVHFTVLGAATHAIVYYRYRHKDPKFPFSALCLPQNEMESSDKLVEFLSSNVYCNDKDGFFMNHRLSSDIVLLKTSRSFEGKYIVYCSAACQKTILSVGPLVTDETNSPGEENSEIIQWLSKKNRHSTVYVCFGSEYFLSKEQMAEIAKGLELCGANFIWVIRFPAGETVTAEEALPDRFLDRVKERGMVVQGWAPQAKILAHPSTAAFVSHCGWSSINESVYFGVPVICMPSKLTMFVDARMVAEEGVGVEVSRDENMSYRGEELAKAIKKAVVETSGEELRHNARQVSDQMKMVEEQEMDEVAEQLWQLCLKKKQVV